MLVQTTLLVLALAIALCVSEPAEAQTRWKLPSAYPADNFHSKNLAFFGKDVGASTGGKLEITMHPGAALYAAPEIKRAVQIGQVEMGEALISLHEADDPMFGIDVVPFLATNFDQARKLWAVSKLAVQHKFALQGLIVLFAAPWPPQGIYENKRSTLSQI